MLGQTKRLKSKLNALRHGVFAKSGLTPWEDPEEFAAHQKKTVSALKPWHLMLEQMAEEIVWFQWLLIRNQRSSLLYALCEPFGREVAKHKGQDDWTVVASNLISQRDAGLSSIAEAGRSIIAMGRHIDDPKQSKRFEKIGTKIAVGLNRVARQYELSSEYFLGLADETIKQADRAMELLAHLRKTREQYFELEQWLVTRNKLVPQLEEKRASDTDAEFDDLSVDDNAEPRRITKDRRDDTGEDGNSVQ